MRIMKIRLSGVLRSTQPGIDLDQEPVRSQLFRDLEPLRYELGERIRVKAIGYLPANYAVFVRVTYEPAARRILATFWIDDPSISGLSGILARRAWTLSLPILAHVFRDAIQERLQTFVLEPEDAKAHVDSFAASRGWQSPPVIAAGMFILTTLFWFYATPTLRTLWQQLM